MREMFREFVRSKKKVRKIWENHTFHYALSLCAWIWT